MAALSGYEALDFIYPDTKSSDFSSSLIGMGYTQFRSEAKSLPAGSPAALTPAWGWVNHGRSEAIQVPSFFDDYYGRIHVTPVKVDFGFVDSQTARDVEVWNSYPDTKTLSDITSDSVDGLSLIGLTPPEEFLPLKSVVLSLVASAKGPATIDGSYQFIFSDAEDPILNVVGQRLLLFPVQPNWESPVLERLEFLTDVLEAKDGSEQRRTLREHPRQIIEYDWTLFGNDKNILDSLLFKQQGKTWSLPLWFQGEQLKSTLDQGELSIPFSTSGRGLYVGCSVLFFINAALYDSYEVISISEDSLTLNRELQQSWPAGAWVYPLRAALLNESLETSYLSANVSNGSVQFSVLDNTSEGTTLVEDYQEYPLLSIVPNRQSANRVTWGRDISDIDYKTGSIKRFDRLDYSKITIKLEFLSLRRSAISAYRDFVNYCKGKYRAFWCPSFNQDMEVVADSSSVDNTLQIKWIGYSDHINLHETRRDIVMWLRTGAVLYRRIVNADDDASPAGTEILTLDQAHGSDIKASNVIMVSYLSLVRADSDAVDIHWITPDVANSTLGFKTTKG